MTAAFYNGLRDDVAGPLIEQFGQDGTLRKKVGSTYDPSSGSVSAGTPGNTAIKLLDLPLQQGVFEEDLEKQMNAILLVSMKETAAASVIAEAGDTVLFTKEGAARSARIIAKKVIGPSGIAVIEKWGVAVG